jgi:hypothetical protein
MSAKNNSTHHRHHSHAGQFVATLTAGQRNSLRLLLAKDAAADLHYLLGVQKAVTRAVSDAEHKMALAKAGRTAELFSDHSPAHIKITR